MNGIYIVTAINGVVAAAFETYAAANTFVHLNGGKIQHRRSTQKQKKAVKWAEEILLAHGEQAKFNGNLDNPFDCSNYLSRWLELAKELDYYEQEIIRDNLSIVDEWMWKD